MSRDHGTVCQLLQPMQTLTRRSALKRWPVGWEGKQREGVAVQYLVVISTVQCSAAQRSAAQCSTVHRLTAGRPEDCSWPHHTLGFSQPVRVARRIKEDFAHAAPRGISSVERRIVLRRRPGAVVHCPRFSCRLITCPSVLRFCPLLCQYPCHPTSTVLHLLTLTTVQTYTIKCMRANVCPQRCKPSQIHPLGKPAPLAIILSHPALMIHSFIPHAFLHLPTYRLVVVTVHSIMGIQKSYLYPSLYHGFLRQSTITILHLQKVRLNM